MPYCPKCKYEYKEGFTVCSDCGVELVDSLDDIKVAILTRDETTVAECLDFLVKNGVESAIMRPSTTVEGAYDLLCPEEESKSILRMLNVYFGQIHTPSEEELELERRVEANAEVNTRYVDSMDRADNYKSGAAVLIMLGAIGIVVLVLINVGILPIYLPNSTKVLVDIVMGALFVAFVALGINSQITYKNLKNLADMEDDVEARIDEWASNVLDINQITEADSDDDSDEIKFFNRTERLRAAVMAEFPDLEPSFREHIIEDMYDRIFECE